MRIYQDSTVYLFAACLMGLRPLLMSWFIIPRMEDFINDITVAEKMGKIYNNKVRVIIAITASIGSIGMIAVQFKVFGTVISYFSNLDPATTIIIAGIIVTIYSTLGGINSVTTTDKLQLATFLIAIPYIILIIIDKTFGKGFSSDGPPPLLTIPHGIFSIHNPKFFDIMMIGAWFLLPTMDHVNCQRILMAKNIKQAQDAFRYSGYFIILITVLIGLIALMLYNFNPNLLEDQIIKYIIHNFTDVGLKGFLIIGVIAMAMSTADSNINASAVLFANDVCAPLNIFKAKELYLSRLFSFMLGAGAIFVALSKHDLLSIILAANKFYIPVTTAPILLTIFGFRSSAKSILIGMFAGLIIALSWPRSDAEAIIVATILNTLTILAFHYITNQQGGWIKPAKASIKTNIIHNNLTKFNNLELLIPNIDSNIQLKVNDILTSSNDSNPSQHEFLLIEIAKLLKTNNISYSTIAKITGLPLSAVTSL
jgi:Na+/proline symporter